MKILNYFTLAFAATFLLSCGNSSQESAETETTETEAVNTASTEDQTENTLSSDEQQNGWELLFDGNSVDQWRGVHKENFPEKGWHVEDGMLVAGIL